MNHVVVIHLRGAGTEEREVACIPRTGDLVEHDGGVWRVCEAVFGEAGLSVFCIKADASLGSELEHWTDQPSTSTSEELK